MYVFWGKPKFQSRIQVKQNLITYVNPLLIPNKIVFWIFTKQSQALWGFVIKDIFFGFLFRFLSSKERFNYSEFISRSHWKKLTFFYYLVLFMFLTKMINQGKLLETMIFIKGSVQRGGSGRVNRHSDLSNVYLLHFGSFSLFFLFSYNTFKTEIHIFFVLKIFWYL